jgi:hypothetical protein
MSQFKVSDLCNITRFDGTYFHVWKYSIKLVFKSENLLKIVKGLKIELVSLPTTLGGTIHHSPPTKLGSKEKFQQNDTHALTIIANCLNNSQVFHINSCNTTKETWDEIFLFVLKYMIQ